MYSKVIDIDVNFDMNFEGKSGKDIWLLIKSSVEWSDLPTSDIIFEDNIKNWETYYQYYSQLKVYDINVESYLLICKRKNKLLKFPCKPTFIQNRIYELIPYILYGEASLIYSINYIVPHTINNISKRSGPYTLRMNNQRINYIFKSFINGIPIHIVDSDSKYIGFGIITEIYKKVIYHYDMDIYDSKV